MERKQKQIRVWYDREGDYLVVIFDQREGHFRETADDRVMEKVNRRGSLLGFSILGVRTLRDTPLQALLPQPATA